MRVDNRSKHALARPTDMMRNDEASLAWMIEVYLKESRCDFDLARRIVVVCYESEVTTRVLL